MGRSCCNQIRRDCLRGDARQLDEADKIGRIGPGMLADLIVLDRNALEIPLTDIGQTRVVITLIADAVVYSAME